MQKKHWRNIVAVSTHDRMIDDNLKNQLENQTLHTSRLFSSIIPTNMNFALH